MRIPIHVFIFIFSTHTFYYLPNYYLSNVPPNSLATTHPCAVCCCSYYSLWFNYITPLWIKLLSICISFQLIRISNFFFQVQCPFQKILFPPFPLPSPIFNHYSSTFSPFLIHILIYYSLSLSSFFSLILSTNFLN